ncbi:MAG: AraC family transcriptional regulator [Tissierella sp.]|uniref:AraC family transcriptional regulator n=1 Tax=Tissierella sp. TaxID=41274 RepID=UPI003F992DB7
MSNILYKFEKKDEVSIKPELLYVSKAEYDTDWHSTMHMHPFTEMFYVTHGKGIFKIEERVFNVGKDDLIIVNSNVIHTESSKGTNALEHIVIGIEGLSVDDENPYTIYNFNEKKEEVLYYLEKIIEEIELEHSFYTNMCQNYLEILIFNILRLSTDNMKLENNKNVTKECSYIKDYIDTNYAENLSLDGLASIAYMNKFYMSRLFKENIGKTPIDYLIDKRISVSKILLETTEHSLTEIFKIVGFSSQSYFNQIFKKRVNMTPREYREKNKE